ncbi:MAG: L-threonylcarbamoyladenylate synthase [Candidatus Promineifilaceae bacterium]
MPTQQLTATHADIQQAATLLQQGQIVVFPTDTVYGIGVNAFDADAIERLYIAKMRPREKGIPILISDPDVLEQVLDGPIDPAIQPLIDAYWPGPLTLILPRHANLPDNISPNKGVAVRIPNSEIARNLIRQAGGALATSSANISSNDPALNAQMAFDALQGRVAAVIDGGNVQHAAASTIIDCRISPPKLVREGPVAWPQKKGEENEE